MNNNDNFTGIGSGGLTPELEARVVAWVLGEASAFEAAQLEVACAEQPELAVFKRRIESVHGLVGEAAKPMKEPLRLSLERRAKVLAVIGGTVSQKRRRKPRSWQGWALPMAACLALVFGLAAVIIPTVGAVRRKPLSTRASEQREMDQRFDAVRVAGGRGQSEGLLENQAAPKPSQSNITAFSAGLNSKAVVFEMPSPSAAPAALSVNESAYAQSPSAPVVTDGDLMIADRASTISGRLANGAFADGKKSVDGFGLGARADVAADHFADAGKQVERREPVAAEVRRRKEIRTATLGDPFMAPRTGSATGYAISSDEKERGKPLSEGRDHDFAGNLPATEESIKKLETADPEKSEANMFLGQIAKEKGSVAELNRVKTQSQMLQEVSNSWQRPTEYKDSPKSSEPWDSPTQPRRKRSSVTITAGVPQTFEGIEFTDADQVELARRIALRKAKRLKNEISSFGAQSEQQPSTKISREGAAFLGYESPADYEDTAAVLAELTAEIKAIEAKANKQAKITVDESQRAELTTATEAVSTFSLHVSDASFRLAKAALERGQAPDPVTVRPEEFYNAFDYGDPAPAAGEAVACRVEQAAHPFLQQRNLVRIAMRVPAAGRGASQPLRLTVLLDTSGSMEREDRAATVRAALTSLTSLLGPDDRVTLVGFARTPRLLAESVAGDQAGKLVELAARTPAEGGTNLEEVLALAGDLAMRQKQAGAQNRIVLLTDGAANLGNADPQRLALRVEAFRQTGIAFDACGVGADGLDDSVLEALTRKGDGRYAVLNSPEEADVRFAKQLAGAFRPAAKDVKVQVHFNPARVARYRLIGFEKHRLKTEDFRNDAIDAAELASEEAAVALYQVEVLAGGEGELGEVFVRFLDTASGERVERSWTLGYAAQLPAFARATPSLQLAGASAFLAEKLRGGALAGQVRLEEFAPVVEGLSAAYPQAERVREFITMFRQTRRLTGE